MRAVRRLSLGSWTEQWANDRWNHEQETGRCPRPGSVVVFDDKGQQAICRGHHIGEHHTWCREALASRGGHSRVSDPGNLT